MAWEGGREWCRLDGHFNGSNKEKTKTESFRDAHTNFIEYLSVCVYHWVYHSPVSCPLTISFDSQASNNPKKTAKAFPSLCCFGRIVTIGNSFWYLSIYLVRLAYSSLFLALLLQACGAKHFDPSLLYPISLLSLFPILSL